MEGILGRYLSIFLPFLATIVLGHLIVRSSGGWQVERLGLASPDVLRRLLLATGSAIAIIVAVDVLTGGDLFLRPTSPRSPILIALVLVTLVAGRSVLRIAERLLRRGESPTGPTA